MEKPWQITENVYLVGGPGLTDPRDCFVYLLDGGDEIALIDAGVGTNPEIILKNIKTLNFHSETLKYLIATHGHIDHIGGLAFFQSRGIKVACHEKELPAIRSADSKLTAAWYYNLPCRGVNPDIIFHGEKDTLQVGNLTLQCLFTPGHTPGGISPYLDNAGKRILFGQDIHGPFDSSWGANMNDWFNSMEKLLALEADILCEGHFGIYSPARKVRQYINTYLSKYGSNSPMI